MAPSSRVGLPFGDTQGVLPSRRRGELGSVMHHGSIGSRILRILRGEVHNSGLPGLLKGIEEGVFKNKESSGFRVWTGMQEPNFVQQRPIVIRKWEIPEGKEILVRLLRVLMQAGSGGG